MAFKFEKLLVWEKALDLSDVVHQLVKDFPREEMFNLSSQMRRAADSVSLNIAEGSTGQTNPEFRRFLSISVRSNMEVVGCLHLARRRGYISPEYFDKIYKLCQELLFMMVAMQKKLMLRPNPGGQSGT